MTPPPATGSTILLPEAKIAAFVTDPSILETLRNLENDWRFARVKTTVHEGDVSTACVKLCESESPDLLLVETDDTGDSFLEKLDGLSGACSENTAAIVIGPINDVYLYRKLVGMGVSDYLVRPIEPETLREVLAATLIDRLGVTESRLIVGLGAKGGVGVSALMRELAICISGPLAQRAVLMDLAGGRSYLGVAMGAEPSTTLREAANAAKSADEDSFNRMLHPVEEHLSILCSGMDSLLDDPLTPAEFEAILDRLMTVFPVVAVDLSSAVPSLCRTAISRAHEIVLVSTPLLSSLRTARSLLQEIKDLRGGSNENVHLVINMQGVFPSGEVSASDIESAIERKPDLVLPFNAKSFVSSENRNKPLSQDKSAVKLSEPLISLAQRLTGRQKEDSANSRNGRWGGLLGKLSHTQK